MQFIFKLNLIQNDAIYDPITNKLNYPQFDYVPLVFLWVYDVLVLVLLPKSLTSL